MTFNIVKKKNIAEYLKKRCQLLSENPLKLKQFFALFKYLFLININSFVNKKQMAIYPAI